MRAGAWVRGRLFRKYFLYFLLLVGSALLVSEATGLYFANRETRAALFTLQREKALGAALRIEQFTKDIERQIGWTLLPQVGRGDAIGQRYGELLKLLRQVPAITDASWLDAGGREQLHVSRLAIDRIGSAIDRSEDPAFRGAKPGGTWFGPVYFLKETEPYMTMAVAPERRGEGVTLAEVNLKLIWDLVSRIRIGTSGYAYVVERGGRLLSHPDIGLVLKQTDLSGLPQVQAALAEAPETGAGSPDPGTGRDPQGNPVLAASAPIPELGWVVLVEQPLAEAYGPLYAAMGRTAMLAFGAVMLAALASLALARHVSLPIRALQEGAARIGAGALDHRLEVRTGDELQALADEFNRMAARLADSYAGLELKVAERTRELERANQARSRLLRAASHDLRQPLHALGLFVAQFGERARDAETRHIATQAGAAVTALRELLDAILDISRLDAGAVTPKEAEFAIATLLDRLSTAFGPNAVEKGLRLRIVPSRLYVRSDPVLLGRILLNLAANALHYTHRGGILVGCRRRAGRVRIEVWDTGIGIAPEQRQAIFREFYQAADAQGAGQGLGLGLAIAARLAALLGSRIEVASRLGRGSVFAVEVPRGEPPAAPGRSSAVAATGRLPEHSLEDAASGRGRASYGALVLVVDDDALVREAMQSLLAQWGCTVVAAATGEEAVALLEGGDRLPDALLCDYRLPGGETGIEVIRRLQAVAGRAIPAALVSADTAPESLLAARASGYPLLSKPLAPAKLRALLEHLVATTHP